MAVIESIPWSNIPKYSGTLSKIGVTNWRTIEALRGNKLLVTIARYGIFGIHHITLSELLEANEKRLTIERPYRFINYKAACIMCYGAGRVDWIQKTRTNPKRKIPINNECVYHYVRTDKITKLGLNLYGSEPKIFEGFEVCPRCKGTGLNVNRNSIDYQ